VISKYEAGITNTKIAREFRIAEIFKEEILNGDPNLERSANGRQDRQHTENSIRCYRVLYKEKTEKKIHQTTLHQF
jgi:hypothetical protein